MIASLAARAAHRVPDRDHPVRPDLVEQRGIVVGAVLEGERLGRPHPATVPAQVQRDHPVGLGEPAVDREEVQVGADGPAVQEQHGRIGARAAGVTDEHLTAPGQVDHPAGQQGGGTGGRAASHPSGAANGRARSAACLTAGFAARAAAPAAIAPAAVRIRAFLFIPGSPQRSPRRAGSHPGHSRFQQPCSRGPGTPRVPRSCSSAGRQAPVCYQARIGPHDRIIESRRSRAAGRSSPEPAGSADRPRGEDDDRGVRLADPIPASPSARAAVPWRSDPRALRMTAARMGWAAGSLGSDVAPVASRSRTAPSCPPPQPSRPQTAQSRGCCRSPVNVEEGRRRGIGPARHVVDSCARGAQGLAADPVMMAAQQQVHWIGPLRCRRHDGPHHGLGRAAACPVLPVGGHGQFARVRRRAPGFRCARASAPMRKSRLHHPSIPGRRLS